MHLDIAYNAGIHYETFLLLSCYFSRLSANLKNFIPEFEQFQ